MIRIEKLRKLYGKSKAVEITSLEIPAKQSFGLVGNNGAGKTTLFRLILDLVKPTDGSVFIKNEPVAMQDEWKSFTGSFLDESFLIDFLTPEEYFDFIAGLNKVNNDELRIFLERFAEFFNDEILNKRKYIRDMSKGNQKKIGLVGAMIGSPELLILDEPFANLDPSSQIKLKQILLAEQQLNGTTMLISSHDLNHVTEISERIVVLEKGDMVKDIATSETILRELESYFT
jgi:ABC-2 type transport system ATP-binding protein